MPTDTYYRDHWIDIDEERLDTYEGMFEWHPRMAPLLVPAELQAGLRVLDYGCGPGGLSVEIGRQVGASGAVIGVDLNTDMVARAQARALKDGLANTVTFQQSSDARLPFPDDSFDRVICKSVLEYVSDPGRGTCGVPSGYPAWWQGSRHR